jgi:hypothetical protein
LAFRVCIAEPGQALDDCWAVKTALQNGII